MHMASPGLTSLLLMLLLSDIDATAATVTGCPAGCSCHLEAFGTKLTVDCGQGMPDVLQLSQQLDLLLYFGNITQLLTSLSIINTPLTRVPASVCQLLNLTSLNLDRNKLTGLLDNCFTNIPNLLFLTASYNYIEMLQNGLFDSLQQLRSLKFRYNRISKIEMGVFSNASILKSLVHVELSDNLLKSLEPWPYVRGFIGTKEKRVNVYLNNNKISVFTNHLGLNLCGGKRPYLLLKLKYNFIHRISDIFTGWNVSGLAAILCSLHIDDGKNWFHMSLRGNPLICDCVDYRMFEFVRSFRNSQEFLTIQCANFGYKLLYTIPKEEFVCNISEGCPSGCLCVYRPGNVTLHVYCSAKNLSSLPYHLPPFPKSRVKYSLDFSNNTLLRSLDYRPYFMNTAILDLSHSAVEQIDQDAWAAILKVKIVKLCGNMIEFLPQYYSYVSVSSDNLDLKDNPWKCSCDNQWMRTWLLNFTVVGALAKQSYVMCGSPNRLKGRSIVELSDDDFCVDPTVRAVTICVFIFAATSAVLIASGLTLYRLRIRFYKRWKFHPFDRDECAGEDMTYDVFLCCSSEDHEPDGLRLLELIESSGFRVCYHLRDFLPGELIMDNICKAVQRSKRTICLLTTNFLESSYCMMEFEIAYHHNMAVKRKKRLIVLMSMDNPNNVFADDASDTSIGLRHYLRQYTYIDYKADDWLDKLLYALPVSGLLQPEMLPNDDQIQLVRPD